MKTFLEMAQHMTDRGSRFTSPSGYEYIDFPTVDGKRVQMSIHIDQNKVIESLKLMAQAGAIADGVVHVGKGNISHMFKVSGQQVIDLGRQKYD